MKYIKTYEYENASLKIGDYVLMTSVNDDIKLNDFLSKNIGLCIDIDDGVIVKYLNIPKNIEVFFGYRGIDGSRRFNKYGFIRYATQQEIDEFKNNYCRDNNMKMIRIPYTELKNINKEYIKNLL